MHGVRRLCPRATSGSVEENTLPEAGPSVRTAGRRGCAAAAQSHREVHPGGAGKQRLCPEIGSGVAFWTYIAVGQRQFFKVSVDVGLRPKFPLAAP